MYTTNVVFNKIYARNLDVKFLKRLTDDLQWMKMYEKNIL